jgi:hypothetical protein
MGHQFDDRGATTRRSTEEGARAASTLRCNEWLWASAYSTIFVLVSWRLGHRAREVFEHRRTAHWYEAALLTRRPVNRTAAAAGPPAAERVGALETLLDTAWAVVIEFKSLQRGAVTADLRGRPFYRAGRGGGTGGSWPVRRHAGRVVPDRRPDQHHAERRADGHSRASTAG